MGIYLFSRGFQEIQPVWLYVGLFEGEVIIHFLYVGN